MCNENKFENVYMHCIFFNEETGKIYNNVLCITIIGFFLNIELFGGLNLTTVLYNLIEKSHILITLQLILSMICMFISYMKKKSIGQFKNTKEFSDVNKSCSLYIH